MPDSGWFRDWDATKPAGCRVTYAESMQVKAPKRRSTLSTLPTCHLFGVIRDVKMQSIFGVVNASGSLHPGCLATHSAEP